MPITPQDYNGDAILGEQLSKLMEKEIRDRLKGDVPETLAHALCAMAAEIDALKAALAASNLGERVADSLDAQSLKVGGEDVVRSVSATASVSNTTGTPSVAVTKGGTASDTTFAFAFSNLKGAKGDTGANGTNGTNGTNGVSCTHSWNGTTLTVTSASGTSSANLKGDKGDKGDTGTWGGTVDQTYNAESQNPQSGAALARHMIRPIVLSNGPTGLTHTETFSSSVPQYFDWTSSNYNIDQNTSYIADFVVQSAYKNTVVNIEIWAKKTTGKTWIGKLTVPLCRGIGYGQIILNRTDGIAFEFSADIDPNDFSVGDEITIIPSFLVG